MEASKTAKKKTSFCLPFTFHLKQKKMNSRTLQKIRGNPQFFSEMKPVPVSSENIAPLQIFTVRHMRNSGHSEKTEKHWKHRKAHRKHPKGIGKEIVTPQNAFVLTSRKDPGIGKASERHRKTSGNIGKHRETSESIGKENIGTPLEEPEQGWKLPLSFGLVDLQYKAVALETFGDCSFLYFNSLLVCSAVKVDRMLVTN